jgi:phospholipase C
LQYRATGLLFFLLVAGAGIVACSGGSPGDATGPLPMTRVSRGQGSTPIKHVVIIIQENRSFDDLFADFPNANGTTTGLAEPMPSPIASSCAAKKQPVITYPTTVPLTEVDLTGKGFSNNFGWGNDLPHVYKNGYLYECDSGASQPSASEPCQMNGFDTTEFGPNGEGPQATCTYTYQYVNPYDIEPYWDMAQQYVLADDAFQTQGSESFTAHQDLIAAGTSLGAYESYGDVSVIDDPTGFPWGCDAMPPSPPSQEGSVTSLITTYGQYLGDKGPFPCFTQYNTMADTLDGAKISWKFYANKVFSWHSGKSDDSGIWSAFDAIQAVRYSKEWGTKVVWPDTKIFTDIKDGTLPDVAWVTPDGANSDHPDERNAKGPVDTGPSWVASVVNKIGESKYWKSCAIVVLWDDWGGFYDHVPPPFYDDQGGLGFRIPMIIISPYVQPHVEHTQYETASVLKFIEVNWNLPSLKQEDQRATSIGNAFSYSQTPRPYQVIPAKYPLSFFLHQKPSGIAPDSE